MANNRLTWQNVSAPDFSGVADSYRLINTLLGNAAKSGQDMISTYTGAQADAADRAIQQRLMAITDPSQFNAANIVGADGARASMAMLKGVGNYQDTLIDRDIKLDTQGQTQRDWDWANERQDQIRANSPQIAALTARAYAGDPNAIAEMAALGMRGDVTADLMKDGSGAIGSRLGQDTTRQRYAITDYEQGRAVKKDSFMDSAASDAEALIQQGFGIDPTEDETIINSLGWDAERTQRARSRMSQGSALAGGAANAGSAIATAAGQGVGNFMGAMGASESSGNYGAVNDLGYSGKYQFGQGRLQDAINSGAIPQMSMKEFVKNPEAQEKAMQWAVGDVDKYIDNNGLDKFIGKEVGGVVMTRDAMRGVAHLGGKDGLRKYLNTNGQYNPNDSYVNKSGKRVKGTSLTDYARKFAGVNLPTQPANLPAIGATPEAMAANNAAAAIASSANQGIRRLADPSIPSYENAGTRDRLSGSAINTLIPEYEELLGSTPQVVDAAKIVADRVGGDVGVITDQIRRVVAEGQTGTNKINVAQAAAIVQASVKGGNSGLDLWGAVDFFGGNSLGGGGVGAGTFSIDRDMVKAYVKDVTSGNTRRAIQGNESEVRTQATVNAADQEVAQLVQSIQRAQGLKQAGRSGIDPVLARLNARLEAAALKADAAARELGNVQKREVPASAAIQAALERVSSNVRPKTAYELAKGM